MQFWDLVEIDRKVGRQQFIFINFVSKEFISALGQKSAEVILPYSAPLLPQPSCALLRRQVRLKRQRLLLLHLGSRVDEAGILVANGRRRRRGLGSRIRGGCGQPVGQGCTIMRVLW